MRVLVVGGAGFTGRAVVEALLAAGHRVRAWDLAPDSWLPVRPRETHTTLGARACTHAAIFCDLAAGRSTGRARSCAEAQIISPASLVLTIYGSR
jgi:nucleoside-diphosphate-sugar epimerase